MLHGGLCRLESDLSFGVFTVFFERAHATAGQWIGLDCLSLYYYYITQQPE